ncbi:MAG: substrate-binding domain-containing protein [Myxococcota bacterium]
MGRKARLTGAGKRLAEVLRQQFGLIDDALEAVVDDHREVRGHLALGSPRPFGAVWLRPRLITLMQGYPRLRITVQFGVPSVLERRLAEGELDLCILVREPELPTVAVEPLYVETFEAVASPRYLKRHGRPERADAFAHHAYIVYDDDLPMHKTWWQAMFGRRAALPTRISCAIDSLHEMMALAEAGVGIAILPDYLVRASVDAGRLERLRPRSKQTAARRSARNTIYLAWRTGAIESARMRVARQALQSDRDGEDKDAARTKSKGR